jgi:nucleotide-binding universal stress UspA family protein
MSTKHAQVGPVVVGYDGRDESEIALDVAIREARTRQVDLVVIVVGSLPVAVGDPLDPYSLDAGVYLEMTPDGPLEIRPIVLAAQRRLAAARVDGTVEWAIGDPAAEIVRAADEHGASAIVVGTHHHSALARFLGADVAATVVRHAHRDVVVAQ